MLLCRYALYNLAVLVEESRRDFPEAKRLFKAAISAAPNDPLALADFGRFLVSAEGDFKAAEPILQRALKADPESIVALFNWGTLCANYRKDKREATTAFQRVLKLDSRHAGARAALANLSK
jgi:Tfp pilus assembly protein PilF